MALGTYPEPHGASPGAPYALREQLPPADVNQIIDNERTLWNVVKGRLIDLESGQLGNGSNRASASTTATTYAQVTHGDSLVAITPAVGDIISGVAGPYTITNADATHSADVRIAIYRDALGTPVVDGQAALIPIAPSATITITFPFFWVCSASWTGRANIQLEMKAGSSGSIAVAGADDLLHHGNYRVQRTI